MVARASRLGRNSSGSGGAYGAFLIFAGLVAGAVVAKRQSRRELATASADHSDSDDQLGLRHEEMAPLDGPSESDEPKGVPIESVDFAELLPEVQDPSRRPPTTLVNVPAVDVDGGGTTENPEEQLAPDEGLPELPLRPLRRPVPPNVLPPSATRAEPPQAPDVEPSPPEIEADPFAWPTESDLARGAKAEPSAAEAQGQGQAQSQNQVSPSSPAATDAAGRLLGSAAVGSASPTEGADGFQSLIDFASSHDPIVSAPGESEPVTDQHQTDKADGPPPLASRPPRAETSVPATVDRGITTGKPLRAETIRGPEAAPRSAELRPPDNRELEQSPWPDLPIPPVTRTASLMTPADVSAEPELGFDAAPTRIERPLRPRQPGAPAAKTAPDAPAAPDTPAHNIAAAHNVPAVSNPSSPNSPDLDSASPSSPSHASPSLDPRAPGVAGRSQASLRAAGKRNPTARIPSGQATADEIQAAAKRDRDARSKADDQGIFYGWILVGAVFVILAFSSGLGFYNASVILAAATDELDTSVGAASGAAGLFFAISGLTGFVFSKQMDSVDLRWFFAIGGLIGAIALAGLQWVTSVVGLYVFFAVFGVGFALAGLVPGTTLVTRWFDRRRSVALSVASTGLSVGGIVVAPIPAWLIDNRGLDGASPFMAALWVIGIVPVALLLVRSYPSEKGLLPDGGPAPAPTGSDQPTTDDAPATSEQQVALDEPARPVEEVAGLDFLAARSTRFFAALCVAYAAIFFGQVGAIAQLFKMVIERSDSRTVASVALGALAGASVFARLAGGVAVAKMDTKQFTAILAVMQAVSLVLLALAPSSLTLVLGSAFFGISIGNLLMLQPLLLAEAFGVRNYSRIYGFNQLFGTIGLATGPFILGVLRDGYDYRIAFFVAAAASLTGFVFIVLAGPTGKVQEQWMPAAS